MKWQNLSMKIVVNKWDLIKKMFIFQKRKGLLSFAVKLTANNSNNDPNE